MSTVERSPGRRRRHFRCEEAAAGRTNLGTAFDSAQANTVGAAAQHNRSTLRRFDSLEEAKKTLESTTFRGYSQAQKYSDRLHGDHGPTICEDLRMAKRKVWDLRQSTNVGTLCDLRAPTQHAPHFIPLVFLPPRRPRIACPDAVP